MTEEAPTHATIVMAEDDRDYFVLTCRALREAGFDVEVEWVEDGDECLDYLLRRGRHASRPGCPAAMVLLDLNMPRKNGYETLGEMKSHPDLRTIPVVVLTSSTAAEDVERAYALGASSYISKPLRYHQLVGVARSIGTYWLHTVRLPDLASAPDPSTRH